MDHHLALLFPTEIIEIISSFCQLAYVDETWGDYTQRCLKHMVRKQMLCVCMEFLVSTCSLSLLVLSHSLSSVSLSLLGLSTGHRL